ncbi:MULTISPECIES: PA14 domain-containing protein [unclassified Streptomyces]|uniref:PA14 domain-containing protein n=1 Tax=unclassified Streptomyces TaxID=2593676 RepID=UPI0022523266|nr:MULTISPECIES: PA14 domain-containing protein [unclassified Streptomyces]WSP56177.1 PA14 domain-containing protein [Streptomyces sp. NBC_01241]WSU23126.1 PA14 domain-containing protein [Streptomyces sp. NBC_01108]MCX4787880.1 PA14 domain-containing protein [Streptomyces sp. NBC_01221]MCX4796357.1 PA14 domain-containing protein [Streptomyces sp. NBC_01242]WSJ37594.1 PA14 domain-containing protein [Streptomyces sp. NBC_01321]
MTTIPRGRLRSVAALSVAATSCSLLTAVSATPAAAATSCTSPVFKRQFFANTSFSGTPKKTDCDSVIDQNWGTGAPASGLPKDNFGVRWSLTRDFGSGGPFAFTAATRDGIRVYLDGVRKVDIWKNVSTTQKKTVNVTVPAGKHSLRIDFVNWTGPANVKFGYAPRTSATVDKVKPLSPVGVKAVLDNATANAKVTWSANKEMDLAGYRVYRRPKGSSTFTLVKTTTATSYAGVPPEGGKTYYFEVRAYDKAGNVSTGSTDIPLTTVAVIPPADFAAKGIDAGIVLTWKPVPGAVRYNLKRDDQHGHVSVRSVTATAFTDTTVKRSEKWTYQVAAVDGAGRASAYGPAVTAYRPVAAPRNIVATPGISSATFTWTTDHSVDGDVYDFHVYRSETLPVDTSAAPIRCSTTWKTLGDGRLQYTCTDTSPAGGLTYHYVIKAYDNSGRESVPSATVEVTTLARDWTPPAPVTGLTAKATEYGIELHWNANTEPDLKRYVVYRGELIDGEDERVCYGTSSEYLDAATTSYTDERLPDGEERCYFIDVEDTSGNSSFRMTHSAEVAVVTELDLTPSVETPAGSPLTLTATRGTTGTSVDLSWNTVADATGYLVERWNPTAGAYEKLTADPVTDVSYTDATAPTGTTHFYRVTAVYADDTRSAPSADWVILAPAE